MSRKRSLHRMLITRIVLVAIAVSAVVSAVVIQRESDRTARVAHDRAVIRTETLSALLRDQLDAPGLGDHDEIRRMLKAIAYQGTDLTYGQYVLARVLDPSLKEVARVAYQDPAVIAPLVQHVETEPVRQPEKENAPDITPVRIEGRHYFRAFVPLADSRGRTAAYVEGFFTTTPEQQKAARRSILGSVALAVGIVLATTLLLYPVILRLMRRLERLSLNLLDANLDMARVVGSTIAKRDSDTDAHNFRVTIYAVRLAEALGLDEKMVRVLIKGAFLHDVGKIGIRDNVLLKPGRLDEQEFLEMKRHVNHGLDIVDRSTWLREASQVVGNHHEKFEGNGYPAGLRGEDIPVLARIFAVVDVFDALTSHRPYKKPLSYEETVDIMRKGSGSHFDPKILDAFVTLVRPLYDRYSTADDTGARRDLETIVNRYYKADVSTFLD